MSTNGYCKCRSCGAALTHDFVDLGMSPLCESFIAADDIDNVENFYPLRVMVCDQCFLVQLREYVNPGEIFTEYAYFSSYSTSWVEHARRYCEMIIDRLALDQRSLVIELASNDGYLLQHFLSTNVPALGIEPAANVAEAAMRKGVPTRVAFFGRCLAEQLVAEGLRADLVIGNNVLAQVPDINDFVAGIRTVLAPDGVATLEFPHLQRLIEQNQFDTIYHEHFSYFSLISVAKIIEAQGLRVFDVEELPTHGGSLRVYLCHAGNVTWRTSEPVVALHQRERHLGFTDVTTYAAFRENVKRTKWKILDFLIKAKSMGKTVSGYGAPGKGNTLLNYCGIRTDFLDYVVDQNKYKHGRFLPGTRIPIYPVTKIDETKPDYIFILPWNLKKEIMAQMAHVGNWGGKFVVPIPDIQVIDPQESPQ